MKTNERLILAIDTAGSPSTVLLAQGSKIIQEKTWSDLHTQSEKTLPYIEQLLEQTNSGLEDIDLIIANQGPMDQSQKPASFTGLKVGITIANGLSLALKIPVIGVSLKDQKMAGVVENSDYPDQEQDFIKPIYSKEPNITIKKDEKN